MNSTKQQAIQLDVTKNDNDIKIIIVETPSIAKEIEQAVSSFAQVLISDIDEGTHLMNISVKAENFVDFYLAVKQIEMNRYF